MGFHIFDLLIQSFSKQMYHLFISTPKIYIYGNNTLFIVSIRVFLLQVTDNPIPTNLYNKGLHCFIKLASLKSESFWRLSDLVLSEVTHL